MISHNPGAQPTILCQGVRAGPGPTFRASCGSRPCLITTNGVFPFTGRSRWAPANVSGVVRIPHVSETEARAYLRGRGLSGADISKVVAIAGLRIGMLSHAATSISDLGVDVDGAHIICGALQVAWFPRRVLRIEQVRHKPLALQKPLCGDHQNEGAQAGLPFSFPFAAARIKYNTVESAVSK